jgi:hypothetical protein
MVRLFEMCRRCGWTGPTNPSLRADGDRFIKVYYGSDGYNRYYICTECDEPTEEGRKADHFL